jgi:hypothetical protein
MGARLLADVQAQLQMGGLLIIVLELTNDLLQTDVHTIDLQPMNELSISLIDLLSIYPMSTVV